MSVLCWIGLHPWHPWSAKYEVKVVTHMVNAWTGEPLSCGPARHVQFRQDRSCSACGQTQTRTVSR